MFIVVWEIILYYIFQHRKDDDLNPTEARESINFVPSMDYSSTHECQKEKMDQVLSPNKSELAPDLLFPKAVENLQLM